MNKLLAVCFLLFALPAWGAEYWATQTGAGAQDGTSLANAWPQGSIVYGGANAFGRGDTLYVCGTNSAPITALINVASVGVFDGTVNAESDVARVSGNAEKCGGLQGVLEPASGAAIQGSGLYGFYVEEVTCRNGTGSCVQQFLSSTIGACAVSAGFYCGKHSDITCNSMATTTGHCSTIATSGITNFPATAVPGLLQENVTSYDSGGAACNLRMHSTAPIQRNCRSYRDGQTSNVWGVYQAGASLNTGSQNSGAGVAWTNVSGNVYKVTQTAFGATSGISVVDIYSPVTAAGVPGDLAKEAGCVTNDATCAAALDAGEWGQIGDVLYVNIGSGQTFLNTRAMYVTYGWNTGGLITESYAEEFADTFDGVGIGLDFGVVNGIIERSETKNNAAYGFACGGGSISCTIRSSISANEGTAAIRASGGHAIQNFSSAGNALVVSGRTHTGETLTVRNVAAEAIDIAIDELEDGTLTETTNSLSPQFIGGTNPTTAEGFKPFATSPLCGAGYPTAAKYDYANKRLGNPPNIGAYGTCTAGRSSYSTRSTYVPR